MREVESRPQPSSRTSGGHGGGYVSEVIRRAIRDPVFSNDRCGKALLDSGFRRNDDCGLGRLFIVSGSTCGTSHLDSRSPLPTFAGTGFAGMTGEPLPSGGWAVLVNQLDIVELASQPPNLVFEKLDPLLERNENPEGCGCDHQNRNALSFVHISQSHLCVGGKAPRPRLSYMDFAAIGFASANYALHARTQGYFVPEADSHADAGRAPQSGIHTAPVLFALR